MTESSRMFANVLWAYPHWGRRRRVTRSRLKGRWSSFASLSRIDKLHLVKRRRQKREGSVEHENIRLLPCWMPPPRKHGASGILSRTRWPTKIQNADWPPATPSTTRCLTHKPCSSKSRGSHFPDCLKSPTLIYRVKTWNVTRIWIHRLFAQAQVEWQFLPFPGYVSCLHPVRHIYASLALSNASSGTVHVR